MRGVLVGGAEIGVGVEPEAVEAEAADAAPFYSGAGLAFLAMIGLLALARE